MLENGVTLGNKTLAMAEMNMVEITGSKNVKEMRSQTVERIHHVYVEIRKL